MTSTHLANLRDKLNTGNPQNIATNMYKVIDAMQSASPATQIQSVALLFLLLTEKYELNRRQVLELADAILRDAKRTDDVHIEAARRYIQGELT